MARAQKTPHFTVRDDSGDLREKLSVIAGYETQKSRDTVSRSDILRRLVDEAYEKLPFSARK